jgi:type VI secretion system protein ImpK
MLRLGLERQHPYGPPQGTVDSILDDGPAAPELPLAREGTLDSGPFDPQRSFLLTSFRRFYAEVARLKQIAIRDPGALVPGEPAGYTPDHGGSQVARAVSQRLQHVLEQLALEAGAHAGNYGSSLFAEAEYAMAAMADEVFLATDWSGRDAWLGVLLERGLFHTQLAGEEVFRRIERVLSNRTGVSAELASVYFMALAAGFEGQYRGGDGSALLDYRRRLYRFIFRRDAGRQATVLLAQPYEHIAVASRPTRLPLVQRWTLVLGITIVAYVVASHLLWRNVTSELRAIHSDIRAVLADTGQVGTTRRQ